MLVSVFYCNNYTKKLSYFLFFTIIKKYSHSGAVGLYFHRDTNPNNSLCINF